MTNAEAAEPPLKKARLPSGQACDSCRQRKQRCDGKRPACSNCDSRGIGASCTYPAHAANDTRTIETQIPEFDCRALERLDTAVDRAAGPASTAGVLGAAGGVVDAQPPCSAIIVQSQDEEAFYGDSSSLDFVSKLSAANPLERRIPGHRRRQRSIQDARPENGVLGRSPASTVSRSIECDMPSREVADSLVDSYFNRVHILYPFLHEPTFRAELDAYMTSSDTTAPVESDYSWLALLYMLFAYGTEFVAPSVRSRDLRLLDANDFVTQARRLVTVAVSQDTGLETVQTLLLLSHYLQGTTELNDCWNVGGLLIRTAMSIGLHIDPSEAPLSEIEKEVRKRVWAGCFIVDRTLSMKFGRPPAIPIASVKRVELPAVVDDQYITNGTTRARQPQGRPSRMGFFVHTIDQAHIIDQILNDLYLSEPRLQILGRSNGYSQTEVLSRLFSKAVLLDGRLQSWWSNLPTHLREEPEEPDGIDFHRQRCVMSLR